MDDKSERSETEKLALEIERMTGSIWGREQRSAIMDLIRVYRFGQVYEALGKVSKLVRASGYEGLSDQISIGKF
jgi:hypothetical protein